MSGTVEETAKTRVNIGLAVNWWTETKLQIMLATDVKIGNCFNLLYNPQRQKMNAALKCVSIKNTLGECRSRPFLSTMTDPLQDQKCVLMKQQYFCRKQRERSLTFRFKHGFQQFAW